MEDTQKLVASTLAGDAHAWRRLQGAIEPKIVQIARRHHTLRRKGLADLPDDIAEVRTRVLERLARDDFRNLREFRERTETGEQPAPQTVTESFESWLYGLVDFVIRDHVRQRFGRAPTVSSADSARVQPSKRDLQTHAGRLDAEPERALLHQTSLTAKLTIAEIFDYMASAFTSEEVRAAKAYFLEDCGYPEIASELGLADAKAAEQLIRRINARLRYRFVNA